MRQTLLYFAAVVASLLATSGESPASGWPRDPTVNLLVCGETNNQSFPCAVADLSGGAIVVWRDQRSLNNDFYAQRIDANGFALWTPDVVGICVGKSQAWGVRCVPDGSAGAIVAWYDRRNGYDDIFAQRVLAGGQVAWVENGVAVCAALDDQRDVEMVPDGSGGAILVWSDERNNPPDRDIYAQRIDADGNPLWVADGVPICTTAASQSLPNLVSDGAGGAIVAWHDDDVYAQRVDASGSTLWTANGVALCSAADYQRLARPVSDGAGGAIVAWEDGRNGLYHNSDIYAQHIDSLGIAQWATDGVPVCTSGTNTQEDVDLVADGSAGVVIVWHEYAGGTVATSNGLPARNPGVYAQRVDSYGGPLWDVNGVAVYTSTDPQRWPRVTSAGSGETIVVWENHESPSDVFAQRLDADGNRMWYSGGVAVSLAPHEQTFPVLVADGDDGAIVVWEDYRNGLDYDVFAQRIAGNGNLGYPTGVAEEKVPGPGRITALTNAPNPFSERTYLQFELPTSSDVTVGVFDVTGRRVRSIRLFDVPAGPQNVPLDGIDDDGRRLPTGVYLYRVSAGNSVLTRKMVVVK
jgi:hypothetical protein